MAFQTFWKTWWRLVRITPRKPNKKDGTPASMSGISGCVSNDAQPPLHTLHLQRSTWIPGVLACCLSHLLPSFPLVLLRAHCLLPLLKGWPLLLCFSLGKSSAGKKSILLYHLGGWVRGGRTSEHESDPSWQAGSLQYSRAAQEWLPLAHSWPSMFQPWGHSDVHSLYALLTGIDWDLRQQASILTCAGSWAAVISDYCERPRLDWAHVEMTTFP